MGVNGEYAEFLPLQQAEMDGGTLYRRIARQARKDSERDTLNAIARDEFRHAAIFERYTGRRLKPRALYGLLMALCARVLGYTFTIQLLERGENRTVAAYRRALDRIPELKAMLDEEEVHEQQLVAILDEERLHYVGDIVLGMNDALVELTGALAGYTLAMQNTGLIAMAGLITGVSATLSMAASGYLSSREAGQKNALKSSAYTGVAYLITVALMIVPYLLFPAGAYLWALGVTLLIALSIIAGFNFYVSVARSRPFRRSFLTMAAISLGVAVISFGIGIVVKNVLGIDL